MVYMALELVTREYIALIYTTNPHVIELVKVFIIYAIMWQGGDAVAAPIQGILRGYKDVNATFLVQHAGLLGNLPAGGPAFGLQVQ